MTKKSAKHAAHKLVRCIQPGVKVEVGEHGHVFQVDEVVDLDAEPTPGLTWREALADHLDTAFEPTRVKTPDVAELEPPAEE